MKWKYNNPVHGETRTITRFLFLPRFIDGEARWLCFAIICQIYEGDNWADDGWKDVCFLTNNKDE